MNPPAIWVQANTTVQHRTVGSEPHPTSDITSILRAVPEHPRGWLGKLILSAFALTDLPAPYKADTEAVLRKDIIKTDRSIKEHVRFFKPGPLGRYTAFRRHP